MQILSGFLITNAVGTSTLLVFMTKKDIIFFMKRKMQRKLSTYSLIAKTFGIPAAPFFSKVTHHTGKNISDCSRSSSIQLPASLNTQQIKNNYHNKELNSNYELGNKLSSDGNIYQICDNGRPEAKDILKALPPCYQERKLSGQDTSWKTETTPTLGSWFGITSINEKTAITNVCVNTVESEGRPQTGNMIEMPRITSKIKKKIPIEPEPNLPIINNWTKDTENLETNFKQSKVQICTYENITLFDGNI